MKVFFYPSFFCLLYLLLPLVYSSAKDLKSLLQRE